MPSENIIFLCRINPHISLTIMHKMYIVHAKYNRLSVMNFYWIYLSTSVRFQVGTLACPLLPLVGVLSNLVFFHVNYRIVCDTCRPPLKRWSQSRNTAFLTAFLLVTLILIIIPISVVIGR